MKFLRWLFDLLTRPDNKPFRAERPTDDFRNWSFRQPGETPPTRFRSLN